jgi:peptidoglycan/xylan/chitin deacetylase (PgdA/CDA1 family)
VSRERFRAELRELHARGYVPVNLSEMLDKTMDIPTGKTPVLFTFDDASPSQFRYIERNGTLVVDPTSAVGMLLDFIKGHPDWKPKGLFCMLPAAEAGHAFFGDKGIDGQKTAWRFKKVQFLVSQGFELCNHTLWHAKLSKYSDAVVQEQLARGAMAIDSAVPGYTVRGFALPYGLWPKNRALAFNGSWYDKKSKRNVRYHHEAVFEVSGGPARSPYDPAFNHCPGCRCRAARNCRPRSTRWTSRGSGRATCLTATRRPSRSRSAIARRYGVARIFSVSSQRSTARRRWGITMLPPTMRPMLIVSNTSSRDTPSSAQRTMW